MKSLQEFIIEKAEIDVTEAKESNEIVFNFDDLENAKETLDSLKDQEGCEIEDNKLTVTITQDNVDKLDTVQDILQKYTDTIRSSVKRSSDESYAQKTKKFAEKLAEFNETLDKIANPEDENDDKKEETDKDKNEDE